MGKKGQKPHNKDGNKAPDRGWAYYEHKTLGAARLAAAAAECDNKTQVLRAAGIEPGGKQTGKLEDLALGADVILPVGSRERTIRRKRAAAGANDKLYARELDLSDPDDVHRQLVEGLIQESPETQTKILLNTNAKLLRQVRQLQDHRDLVKATIEEAVTPLKPIVPKFPQRKPRGIDEEIMIFQISDLQGGQFVFGHDTGGLEHYSWEVFEERVERYKHGAYRFANDILRKSYPIRRALVIINGDVVEGENIYPLQRARIDMAAMQQVAAVASKLIEILAFIAGMFDYVEVLCVYGNHGRVKMTRINLDWFVYALIERAFVFQPNVDVLVSDSHFMAFWLGPQAKVTEQLDWSDNPDTIYNYNILHGDNIPRYMTLPYYGMERAELRYMKMTGIIFAGTFVAHHHRAAAIEDKYINGSWVGGNEYSVRVMQGVSQPCQKWFLWHPKQGITLEGHIKLADRPKFSLDDCVGNVYTPVTRGALPTVEEPDVPLPRKMTPQDMKAVLGSKKAKKKRKKRRAQAQ